MRKQNDTTWLVTMKPNFVLEIAALLAKEAHQVWEKIHLLMQDPTPDAKVKKQLKYMHGKLHRIRSGRHRIFYTFAAPYISLLTVRYWDDDTHDEDLDPEFLGGLDPQWEAGEAPQRLHIDWGKYLKQAPEPVHPLPSPVTAELLASLRVPTSCHSALLAVMTEEELFASGVPDEYIINLHDYLCKRPLAQVVQQPDLVLNEVEDLTRYKEGELLGFLLKLSLEQEKYVNWALHGQGPALLKGSSGTGKSTIALYRVRALIKSLRSEGKRDIRILFTTYTNALARSSRQLLAQLLGSGLQYVEVQTADKLVRALLGRAQITPQFVETSRLRELARRAIASTAFAGNVLQQHAQHQTLQRLGYDYLLQEFQQVIVARQLRDLEAYQRATRPGRQVRLNALQREAVWQFARPLRTLLEQAGLLTWAQARALVAQYVEEHQHNDHLVRKYDAVLIDEAQDLDPTVLRLLVQHCAHPQRLFITADANQSIYGSGFNWSDIHADLQFRGRTGVLRTNYRSTYEIGEAARIYLADGQLDDEPIETASYKNNGPRPVVATAQDATAELELLARFLPNAVRELRLGLNSCAVLCPTTRAGRLLADGRTDCKLPATFMTSQELDLSLPGLKVLTLNSAKGLEFPVVALAGFVNPGWQDRSALLEQPEARAELLSLNRRTIFVGMTRAMRALLVLAPADKPSELLRGFAETYWDTKG